MADIQNSTVKIGDVGQQVAKALLEVGTASVAPLYGCAFRLYTNDVTPDKDSEADDFTEATFTGYAAQTPAWSNLYRKANGNWGVDIGVNEYICSADLEEGEQVYGWYATNGSGEFVMGGRFSEPVPIALEGDNVLLVAEVEEG